MADDVHSGHRKRLKKRFLLNDIDDFEHHNILELLLFFSIPRSDTNVIAHKLMNKFGSISEVFDAPLQELVNVDGITETSATLIKLIPSLSRVYMQNKVSDMVFMDTSKKMGEYFVNRFIGKTKEIVYIMCLDSSHSVISCELLTQGTVSSANISMRKLVEIVIRTNACGVVLSHNHPRGLAVASNEDVITTVSVKNILNQLDINLLDHIIVAQNQYASLAEMGYI